MELLLNLIWLIVALVSIGAWWIRWLPRNRGGRHRGELLRGALGLTCVLVLLFFAISLTDDLHAVPAVAESNSSRRAVQNFKGGQTDPDPDKHTTVVAEAATPAVLGGANVVVGRLARLEIPAVRMAPKRPAQGRAPPLVSL